MTLYLKYRPQLIDELDLESVRQELKNIIASNNIPHAFLFSGPKGTGKTSAARILAKVINCTNVKNGEPCNTCDSCLSIMKGANVDIIELDAASNRGIDDIRNLKEGIYLSPINAKVKVYIIDEAHMLTLEAANAFLKTLEEPPSHVVFILATTNPEKLPETVISRTFNINFTKATEGDISRQLTRVSKGENVSISKGAIKQIAKLADGSFRDAVKILESLILAGKKDIKENDIDSFESDISSFFKLIKKGDTKKSLEFIENLNKSGISIKNFTNEIIASLHKSILSKNGVGNDELTDFSLTELLSLNSLLVKSKNTISPIPQLPLEIAIIKFLSKKKPLTTPEPTKKIAIRPTKELDAQSWQKLLDNARTKNFSIEALLRAAKPLRFDGNSFILGIYYKFHKEKLEDLKNTKVLEELCKETFGLDSVKIVCELLEKPTHVARQNVADVPVKDLSVKVDKDIIDAAKEIFG